MLLFITFCSVTDEEQMTHFKLYTKLYQEFNFTSKAKTEYIPKASR